MMLLLRKRDVAASTAIDNNTYAEYIDTVSLDKVRELLKQVRELRKHNVTIKSTDDGEIVLKVDTVTYSTRS